MEKILEVHGCCPIIWLNSWPFQIHSHGIHGVLKFIITEFMAFSSSWSWNSWRFHIHSHRIHDILIFIVMESWLYNLVHMNMSCMTIFVGLKLFLDCYIVNKMGVETTFRISYVMLYVMRIVMWYLTVQHHPGTFPYTGKLKTLLTPSHEEGSR